MAHHDHGEAAEWDGFYAGDGDDVPHWSGQPNPTLVTEAAALPPGRALDVGCGEGGDAVWLATCGWQVTAIDPSNVALDRARAVARAADVDVTWIGVGLLDLQDTPRGYDLVSVHYPVLRRGPDEAAITALLEAVAPGGTLLFVHHELDPTHAGDHGVGPATHVMPDVLAAHLGDRWEIEVHAARERHRTEPADRPSPRDVVLRARRR